MAAVIAGPPCPRLAPQYYRVADTVAVEVDVDVAVAGLSR